MLPRRLTLTIAACLLLGFLINFAVAAILGARPDLTGPPASFGFLSDSLEGAFHWAGDRGRDRLAIHFDRGLEGVTSAQLQSRFQSYYSSRMTPDQVNTWSSRLFPRWADWAQHVTAAEGSRDICVTGLPLRAFAGYNAGAPMHFSSPRTASAPRESGFLWRDHNSRIRAVVYIPLPLGAIVNTIVFASPLLAFALIPTLHRSHRLRRGHCPRCNYNLLANFPSGCPECGWNRNWIAEKSEAKLR